MRHGAKRKKCSHEGCTNNAVKGGVCVRHGAKHSRKRRSEEGCTNYAMKHYAKLKTCSHETDVLNVIRMEGTALMDVLMELSKKEFDHKGCTNVLIKGGVCMQQRIVDVTLLFCS